MALPILTCRFQSLSPSDLPTTKLFIYCWLVVVLSALGCNLASPPVALAQMNMSDHAMETQDETAPGELPAPRKMTGLGNAHMQITATPEARMWFDQGLNLLHDFWDYESARAFEQSVRVDPQCAICYWGLYQAESFYHSTAKGYAGQALAKAVSLENHASKRERLYIEATAAYRNELKNARPGVPSQSLELWRKLVSDYPKDIQARIFLSRFVDHKESVAILQSVLKEEPGNSAANHYFIHALEGSQYPGQALHSAEILASLAPASGHMVHMPGHIFFRIGDYHRAEQAFTASMQVDERYMQEQHVQPDNDWNYVHNIMYAIANLMEQGKLKEATALSAKLTAARGKLESTLYIYSTRDSITRLDPKLPVALRIGDWAEVIALLKLTSPIGGRPHLDFLARQLGTFAAGMQAIENHELPRAEESSVRVDAQLRRMSQELKASPGMQGTMDNRAISGEIPKLQVMPDALLQPLLNSLSVMSLELRASLLTAHRKTGEAKSLFRNAAQQEKALGYHEPPNYIRPVGETEGAAMIAAGDWTDAKAAYEQALLERPRSGFALYGIAMSSEKAGDAVAAAKGYANFLTTWKNADPALTQMTHAQIYLAEHAAAGGGKVAPASRRLHLGDITDPAVTARSVNLSIRRRSRSRRLSGVSSNLDNHFSFRKLKKSGHADLQPAPPSPARPYRSPPDASTVSPVSHPESDDARKTAMGAMS
jgi:tetratricopeptide (TPR) repeat protein